jgi:hypothetical protein
LDPVASLLTAEPGATFHDVLKTVARHPSGILLFAQLAAVLLYPFMEGNDAGRAIFSAFGIGLLALVVMAVRSTPALLWVSFIFALPAIADREITTDELFAVGATFTLVAWAFAYMFTVVQAIEPGSFTAAVDPDGERTWMELLYLSFTTLTSVGLSDIVPLKAFARGLVMIEQVAGLGYIALVVSRLVSLTVIGSQGRPS